MQTATIPPVQAPSTKLADGVWHVTGGSHHSVVVEFDEYVAVVEGPLNEERSLAVLAEAKKLVPNKPVQYVLTTHHHFDHTGGLRTYVAEGATVVTHESNVPFFEKTLRAPATLVPDMQAKNPKPPTLLGVSDKYVITDGKQTVEVYTSAGDTHTNEYTLVYLPGPRILVEADTYSPGPPDAPPPRDPVPRRGRPIRRHPASEAERRHHCPGSRARRRSDCGIQEVHRQGVTKRHLSNNNTVALQADHEQHVASGSRRTPA